MELCYLYECLASSVKEIDVINYIQVYGLLEATFSILADDLCYVNIPKLDS